MKIHTVQLHLGDLLEGTQDMDNGEYGAYVALFLAFYNLPDQEFEKDDARMARMAKCDNREWRRVKNKVLSKFIDLGTKVTHNRVKKDVELYNRKSEINSLNALKMHERRSANASNSHMRNACETHATQDPRPKTQDKINNKKHFAPIPEWVPIKVWNDFCKHRGSKFTLNAQNLLIDKLDRFRQDGEDPSDVLKQSIMSGWSGIFPVKGKQNASIHSNQPLTGHAARAKLAKQARETMEHQQFSTGTVSDIDQSGRSQGLLGYDQKPFG